MTDLLAALDIGGTKTHLVIEAAGGGRLVDVVEPSEDWEAEPAAEAAAWIAARIARHRPADGRVVALALGAQGVNRAATAAALQAALAGQGLPATVVNDAALIVPAAGLTEGIGIIAGTGAIGVGADAGGAFLTAGGWGSIIGDEGSAAGLVREAARAALRGHDQGRPDDGLLGGLLAAFAVADAERLARRVNDDPTVENWAPHASAVFAAADAGSALARAVIADGARHLVDLVVQLRGRGAAGSAVVVAGSVIVNQPRLLDAVRAGLADRLPGLALHVLRAPPVEGAVLLARRRLG
ncbi:BadF/BadG/BcrA/BcrD ATPase family protein [Inquilinus sp.]|jgi:N-acetylglucosamine kinase-like BadF-type ATPase|uniref:BadF/BadG/BcrA/BcrD ATPase family protein n=1 Tax=Inquilinus sp. TaxID=1932117 RepID=UPI00378518D7